MAILVQGREGTHISSASAATAAAVARRAGQTHT